MITLKQAIKLLDLHDDDIVYFCKFHCQTLAKYYSVKEIRNKFDMKRVMVKRIYPHHFWCDPDLSWEFIIQ